MSKITSAGLRRLNFIAAILHAAQGIAVLALSTNFSLPVTGAFLQFNPSSKQLDAASNTLFHLSLPWLVAVFFFLSAAFHSAIATFYQKTYVANLARGINRARWFEYSISASIMMVAIAMLVGIYDVVSLAAIFGLIALMNLCGLAMEVYNQGRPKVSWLAFNIGSLAGIIPWAAVAFYIANSTHHGSAPPTFVYFIFGSIFVFFSCFALNMWLQYKRVGKWADYLYGEKAYIWLSLVAKSLLAWQVFAGTLRP